MFEQNIMQLIWFQYLPISITFNIFTRMITKKIVSYFFTILWIEERLGKNFPSVRYCHEADLLVPTYT
jgi:hypothetical protein